MKALITSLFLTTSLSAMATDYKPNQGASALAGASAGAIASTGNVSASNNNGGNDMNFLALPSTTSATATSGNAGTVCPLITVKSEAKQYAFGLYSKSVIAEQPARVNGLCVFYYKAIQSGEKADWDNFVNYARSVEPSVDTFLNTKKVTEIKNE